jgi:hypothetical protein
VTQILPAIFSALRKAFAWERLPPAPEPSARGSAHPRARVLRLLLGRELLAVEPERHLPRRRWLALLFAIEPLPRDSPALPRPRARWMRWLFAPEPLDPP